MKRKLMTLGLIAVMTISVLTGCGTPAGKESTQTTGNGEAGTADTDKKDGYTICWTVGDLSNPIWAEKVDQAKKTAEEYGCNFEAVSCDNDSSKQVAQIESFIERKVDAIMIGAADPNALDDVCKKAMDAGIVIMVEGIKLNNYTISMIADNYEAGKMIGEETAKFINENYDGVAEVGLITYYENNECTIRGQGMVDALTELCPGAKVVQECSTCVADEAMTYVENWLQANPDMKAIMSIGDGGGIGANQAVKAAGKDEGFGIFAVDGTVEALQLMADGDPIRAELSFGSGWQLGEQAFKVCYTALTEDDFDKDVYEEVCLVTYDNLKDKVEEWGYEDRIDLSNLK